MPLKIYDYQLGDNGSYYGESAAFEFYQMTGQWADELPGADPLIAEEPFYLLAALKLGDPDRDGWIKTHAKEFYEMWDEYCGKGYNGAAVLIRYMLWYERDRPKD